MSYANPMMRRGAAAYARLDTETAALSASRHRLITMLFDGTAAAINFARGHMQAGRVKEKGQAISKAIDIVDNGLKAGLDASKGGAASEQLVANLSSLYDYIVRLLLEANLKNDPAKLAEAARLLEDIASAWREIAPLAREALEAPVPA